MRRRGRDAEEGAGRRSKFVAQKRRQILAAGIATLGTFGLGAVLNWSAPVLPNLEASQDLGDVSSSKSWMTSLAFLGALISSSVSSLLMNYFGRRKAMTIVSIPFIIGWLLIAAAKPAGSVILVCIGRIIIGFCGASFLVFVPVYVGETADPRIRGALSTMMILMLVTGVLFVYILGVYFPWYILSAICAIPPAIILICMPLMPETPRYLISKGDIEGASKSLQWLRGATNETQVRKVLLKTQESFNVDKEDSSKLSDLFVLSSLKPTIISLILIFFQQTCGAVTVSLYTVEVFDSAGTNLNPNLASIIISICEVATVFVPTLLVDRVGRKVLLYVSEGIMIVSLTALAIFFHFKDKNEGVIPEGLGWLPLTAFISFTIGYNVGMGPIPFLVISELLPSQSRGLATSVVTSFYWIIIFISAQTFEDMIKGLGWSISYGVFATLCILGTFFIVTIIPETKGKNAEDIELHYGRRSTVHRVSLRNSLVNRGIPEIPPANEFAGGVVNASFQAEDSKL